METWENTLISALTPEKAGENMVVGQVVNVNPLTVRIGELDYSGSRLCLGESMQTRDRKISLDNVAEEYESRNKVMTIYEPINVGDRVLCAMMDERQWIVVVDRLVTRVVKE